MDVGLVAARRATFYSLHASALFGGAVALVAWLAFRTYEAALVAGGAGIVAALLAILARRAPLGVPGTSAEARGALLVAYAVSLLTGSGLLIRAVALEAWTST
jgi:hypothetical protein